MFLENCLALFYCRGVDNRRFGRLLRPHCELLIINGITQRKLIIESGLLSLYNQVFIVQPQILLLKVVSS